MVWFWIQFFRGAPYFFYQIKKRPLESIILNSSCITDENLVFK